MENIRLLILVIAGLIALYLLVKFGGGGFSQLVQNSGNVLITESKTLQGR